VPDLAAADPLDGLDLPRTAGGSTLAALPSVARWAVAPFAGREAAVAAALGAALPPCAATPCPAGRVLWAGDRLWLVEGEAPALDPADAAVVEASDAFAGLVLTGPAARDVLARLVPLDLDPAAFPPGAVARTLLRHLPLVLVAASDGFELLVPRSSAGTAVRDLARAMTAVAGRAAMAPARTGPASARND
jgi:heterotetrameric sarcosine oxidase gamma subunit